MRPSQVLVVIELHGNSFIHVVFVVTVVTKAWCCPGKVLFCGRMICLLGGSWWWCFAVLFFLAALAGSVVVLFSAGVNISDVVISKWKILLITMARVCLASIWNSSCLSWYGLLQNGINSLKSATPVQLNSKLSAAFLDPTEVGNFSVLSCTIPMYAKT